MKTGSGLVADAQPWLNSLRAAGRSEFTLARNARVLGYFQSFLETRKDGPVRARDVSPADIQAWQQEIGTRAYKDSMRECCLRPLAMFFGWLERVGRIFANPCRDLEIPKYERPMQWVPSETEMSQVLGSLRGNSPTAVRDRAIMEVLYGSGLRRIEMARLTLDSIRLDEGVMRVIGKGRERVVPLTRASVTALGQYLAGARGKLSRKTKTNSLWLSANTGKALNPDAFKLLARRYGRAVGVTRLSTHALRRAFATHMLLHGATPEELRRLLGHANYQHLRHYLRYVPQQLIAAHGRSRLAR